MTFATGRGRARRVAAAPGRLQRRPDAFRHSPRGENSCALGPLRAATVPAVDDAEAMGLALDEARAAASRGEVPVGAVVLAGHRVVGSAGNEREATGDPTAHAEIVALRQAAAALGSWRLTQTTLYVTLEPCPMCAGALVAARVGRVVFATPDPKAGACGSLYNLCADPRLNHELPVRAGVRSEEASELISGWFAARRDDGKPSG